MRSLQRTLALRYGLTMLVALVAIALWAFLGVKHTLERELDRALDNTAGLMVDVVEAGEALPLHRGPADLGGFTAELNRLVVTRDATGRLLERNSPLADSLAVDPDAFAAALAGGHAWASGAHDGRRIRSVYVPLPPAPGVRAPAARVLQVAASMQPLQAASDSILLRMLLTALIGALATTAGAGWLARSSSAPVADITAQARAMGAHGGGRRITAHADVVEVQDLIETLNGLLGRLDDALRQQRRIISDVGHDLRTPVTALRGEVEVALRSERSPAQYQALLRSMLEEIDHLGLIGDALVTLARLETGETGEAMVPTDLVGLVRAAAARAGERGMGIALETPAAPVVVHGHERMLVLALDQLLENAQRHTPPGTPVRVALSTADGNASVQVEDGGPGVPEEELPRLFEPFFRRNEARSRGGAGLGLTLVRSVANAHGGRVEAGRSPLGGLLVRLTIALDPRTAVRTPATGSSVA